MPNNIQDNPGRALYDAMIENKKIQDRLFDKEQKVLKGLNKWAASEERKILNEVIGSLKTNDNNLIETTPGNLAKSSVLMGKVKTLQEKYKKKWLSIVTDSGKEFFKANADKIDSFNDVITSVGIAPATKKVSDKGKQEVSVIQKVSEARLNSILKKWAEFVRSTFNSLIVQKTPIAEATARFFQENGHIKIGSSLDEESEIEALMRAVEERTAYQRDQAAINGYTCCWNSNPMDKRTKPECIEATSAGVIPESKMSSDHGFPPRNICRCDITFVRCEWKRINDGINEAITESRNKLKAELLAASSSYLITKPTLLYASVKDQIKAIDSAPDLSKNTYLEDDKEARNLVEAPDRIQKPANASDVTMKTVNMDKLDDAWKKDTGFYIDSSGSGAIGGRQKNAEEYMKTGKPIDASIIEVDANGVVSFIDGRHRMTIYRDVIGVDKIKVAITNSSLDNAKKAGLI